MNTMDAVETRLPREHRPPSAAISETSSASTEGVDGALPPRPAPPPLAPPLPSLPPGPLETSGQTSDQTNAFPLLPSLATISTVDSLPSPRTGRSQSLAIKRKPLSSTASPIATRYSTRDYLDALHQLPRPEQRFSRSCSLDSPTLYEFPDRHVLLPTGTGLVSSAGSTGSSEFEFSQPYVSPRRSSRMAKMVAKMTD